MDEIVGHSQACSFFDRAISAAKLHHAYAVFGPDHVGKTVLIERVIGQILHTPSDHLDAHPDFVRVRRGVDEKTGKERTDIVVGQIHALQSALATRPVLAPHRVAFIEEAALLNKTGANALLKTLEEPMSRVVIFLRTTHESDLPKTILSRVQRVRLSLVSAEAIASMLVRLGASKKEAQEFAGASHGCPGLARTLLLHPADHEARARDRAQFEEVLALPLAGRSLYLSRALPKGQPRAKALELVELWEDVLRARWHASGFGAPQTAVLQRLFQTREALQRNAPPVLALEHTLFFV
ncbi:AAA family ATPase [Candidatus Uhrbacteria bacterium]|nr:AAA family ATPase [Candidatus Uhrbacteria bacterium]